MDGAKFAAQLVIQWVAIEIDCLQMVQLWNKVETSHSIIDPILWEIDELRLAFQEFYLSFISRNCNKVEHSLDKEVSILHRSETWHVTPTCVYDLIMFEASDTLLR
jgi:hypothetical protein